MPNYEYVARTKEGTIQKNTTIAINQKAVVEALRAQGLIPTSISEVKAQFDINHFLQGLSQVKLIDKITFIKNLAVMVKSGLPVSKSLKILTEQTSNKKFAGIIGEISRSVEAGSSLAE